MKEVKKLKNGNIISQGAGKFDNYCVFIDGYAPRDEEYFNFFIEKSKIYGKDKSRWRYYNATSISSSR